MKKSIAFIAALAITSSLASAIPSFAAEEKTVTVSTTYASTYTVTIPDEPIDPETEDNTITVSAENVKLEQDQSLNVSVASGNEFKLSNGKGDEVAYQLKKGGVAINTANPVLTVEAGTDSAELEVDITGTAQYAGTYSDTLTFSVAVG